METEIRMLYGKFRLPQWSIRAPTTINVALLCNTWYDFLNCILRLFACGEEQIIINSKYLITRRHMPFYRFRNISAMEFVFPPECLPSNSTFTAIYSKTKTVSHVHLNVKTSNQKLNYE